MTALELPVRVSIFVALLALACGKSDREMSKQMNITDITKGHDHRTETCVEGDEATCTRAGGRWDRSVMQCCLPKASCDLGDEAACARSQGKWTGKYCCLLVNDPNYQTTH